MKIGILQTGHAPDVVSGELGDYDAMFAGCSMAMASPSNMERRGSRLS